MRGLGRAQPVCERLQGKAGFWIVAHKIAGKLTKRKGWVHCAEEGAHCNF